MLERVAALTAERDEQLRQALEREKAAIEAEREARAEYAALVSRRSQADELLAQAEGQLESFRGRLQKMEAKANRLETQQQEADAEWEKYLSECLAECTLKPKKDQATLDSTTYQWKRQQRTVGEQLRESLEPHGTHGAKLPTHC